MNPLVVYQSKTGNTQKLVDTIVSTLNADLLSVDKAKPDHFKERTLVGFGSGIYWSKIDRKIYELATFIPEKCKVFIFITSGLGLSFMLRLYWYYIKKNFDRLGVSLVERWDCRGYDQHLLSKWMGISKGHPNTFDIESAKQFAMRMKDYM